MVYKKYIRRGDKVYGPYFYKSIKKDGKVITEYIGKSETKGKFKSKKIFSKLYIILGLFGLLVFFSLIVMTSLGFRFTGNVILDVESSYEKNQPIDGILKFILAKNEFIPASTEVVVTLGNFSNNYTLSDLIPETTFGNFYVKNKNISGSGEGYGFVEEDIFNVSFELEIYSEIIEDIPIEKEPEVTEENVTEVENITIEEPAEENVTVENITIEEPESIEENITEEEAPIEEPVEEFPLEEEIAQEVPVEELEPTEEELELTEEEESEEEEELSLSPITGQVISASQIIIEGSVSENNPFIYEIEEGQTAEIISSSQEVNLEIKNNTLIVTTKTKSIKELVIDLAELNILAQEGTLAISLIYNNIELFFASKKIRVKQPAAQIIFPELNETKFVINVHKEYYSEQELVQVSGELIINGTNITDDINISISFNNSIIKSIIQTIKNGSFAITIPVNFQNEGEYDVKAFYNGMIAKTNFSYLLLNETNQTKLEGFICKNFKEDVLWSSGYSAKAGGSTEYYIWEPTHNCSEVGNSACLLHDITVQTRFLHTTPDISITDSQGEGYVQISQPDKLMCGAPVQGNYSKYLAYKTILEGEKDWGKYCKKDKNSVSQCSVGVFDKYFVEDLCYGIKVFASQYSVVDVIEIKYDLCWEK